MSTEIAKAYSPASVEEEWYARWLAEGAFRADETSAAPAFSIVIPPPNITGILTLGHVLNNSIQDILCRRARMQGKAVLWLPGTDHAGLATQTAVEKALRKEEQRPRHDLGREEFLRRTWQWQEKHGGIIIQQLKRLGCSCDWSRQRFTMDDAYVKAVQQVFVELFDRGYIYRGKRMVNWCPASLTAISDEEVIPTAQKGFLYHMRYEVADQPGRFLEIATTRPETLMADTGVAVHPKDPRYADLIGKEVWRPFPKARLPIVADEAIDMEFGTGVLKVTPAHDKVDFDIGERHHLPILEVIDERGKIDCPEVPELHGLDRFEARKKAAEMLEAMGQLKEAEPYENNVGFSERGNVPIEPRLSEQWFLRYPKVPEALKVVREGLIQFVPKHWEKTYEHWLEGGVDWCISRQVWWGHRIPVWYKGGETRCQIESPDEGWEQDADTLDTWFSSWLWAYETMDPATRAKFYPTSVLVTGPDIIFLWVARMIIAGLEFLPGRSDAIEENIAFRHVYFTGLIRDAQGRKLSKSLGNSPDPLVLMDQYGADGLRFGLLRIAPQGSDIRYDEKQIEEGRNFGNKLWNAARFRLMNGAPADGKPNLEGHALDPFALDILGKLEALVAAVDAAFETFKFSEIAQRLYDFFWGEYCDGVVEASKSALSEQAPAEQKAATLATMDTVFHTVLRLLHPYMPHITEELWGRLGFREGERSIMFHPWPVPGLLQQLDAGAVQEVTEKTGALYETVKIGRNLRATYRIASNQKARFVLAPTQPLDADRERVLGQLLNAEPLELDEGFSPAKATPAVLTPLGKLYLPLEGLVDVEAERGRLGKEIEKVEKEIMTVRKKLSNEKFVDNAPAEVVEEHRQREKSWQGKLAELQQMLGDLPG